ncbi:DUF397 domain-containing protein [Streptomyces paromomycinus]|uniref:DUF397 domain-containing protein n=1 Tax=Streptomyces paromomycinus TaxID=92743 RepID=A0A401W9H0_STREY|nr:DUF397 domain-containing protein [Streptomyces paromomycinus]GCD45941.1 DUF397 domain-containing protein [Streptomyces paromomycinus]
MPAYDFLKSSYSNEERECVEVATNHPHHIAIRDSKRTDGPTLHVTPTAWTAFLATLHVPH